MKKILINKRSNFRQSPYTTQRFQTDITAGDSTKE